jgi:hypothetical protein
MGGGGEGALAKDNISSSREHDVIKFFPQREAKTGTLEDYTMLAGACQAEFGHPLYEFCPAGAGQLSDGWAMLHERVGAFGRISPNVSGHENATG